MPNRSPASLPKYGKHTARNLARVRIQGKDYYLGEYGSPESYERYDRLVAEYLARGRRAPNEQSAASEPELLTVNDVLLAFWKHAASYYVKNGQATKELVAFQYAIQPVQQLYGSIAAVNFGPLALKAVRETLIEKDLCRGQVNARVNRVKRIFKWAVSEELVPAAVYEGLRTVAGLRVGRSRARESKPVKPVPLEHVHLVLPYVSPQVSAMIQLQMLTGMRAGEVVIMCPGEIDRTGEIWVYEPTEHKTMHRGFHRQIPLGPKAQALIKPFLDRAPNAFLFSPAEAEAWRNERRAEFRKPDRKTKIYPSELRSRQRAITKSRGRRGS